MGADWKRVGNRKQLVKLGCTGTLEMSIDHIVGVLLMDSSKKTLWVWVEGDHPHPPYM